MLESRNTYMPPTILIHVILLNDFNPLSSMEGDFVFILWMKVMQSIDVVRHDTWYYGDNECQPENGDLVDL
jgi:hypothetical protein